MEYSLNAEKMEVNSLELDAAATSEPALEHGPKVAARLIEYAPGHHIALPLHTVYALIEQPTFVEVPGASHYAYGLLTWQGERLPLLDLDALLHAETFNGLVGTPRYALIAAYQPKPREPLKFGAIVLTALPQTIAVGNEMKCELPDDSQLWPLLALSCFTHEGQAVPILDTKRIFTSFHDREMAASVKFL